MVLLGYKTSESYTSLKQTTIPRERLANTSAQLTECARQTGQRDFAVTRTDISWRKRLRVNTCHEIPDQARRGMDGHSAIRTFASIFLWKFHSIYAMQSGYIPDAFLFEFWK